jgi:hypothetical protein
VAILVTGDEQNAITVIVTVTVGSKELSLYILANDLTTSCETSQLEEPREDTSDDWRTGSMIMHTTMPF